VVIDARLRHKDGSWRWVEGRVTNLLENPAVRAVVSNFRDITERKLVEEKAAWLASFPERSSFAPMGRPYRINS
jgi:hypothetical protein